MWALAKTAFERTVTGWLLNHTGADEQLLNFIRLPTIYSLWV